MDWKKYPRISMNTYALIFEVMFAAIALYWIRYILIDEF